MTPINVWHKGRVEAIAYVDDADAAVIQGHRWLLNNWGYASSSFSGRTVLMHRIILNAKAGQIVDHLNHDKLMNVRSNLRICTQAQNITNQIKAGRVVGVGIHRKSGKWIAYISSGGKHTHLGLFESRRDAIRARFAAVLSYWRSQKLDCPEIIRQTYATALLESA